MRANLVNYLWPLLIVVLSPLLLPGTRLYRRHVAGALLGFAGTVFLVFGGSSRGDVGVTARAPFGYALTLAAAFIWSTYSLITKRIGAVARGTTALACVLSGALSLGCHAAFEPHYAPRATDWGWLVLIGAGPMGVAFYLWERAMKGGDPRMIGTLAYLTPLLSTVVIAISGEGGIDYRAAFGGALIVSGGALSSWSARA